MNSIILTGRLTRDPELRTAPSGKQVVSFSIAVDRRFAKDGQQKTDFIPCQAWDKTAEFIAKWFGKGKMICVSGRLQVTQTEKDGSKKTYFNVVADNAEFCGSKNDDGDSQTGLPHYNDPYRQPMPSYNGPQDASEASRYRPPEPAQRSINFNNPGDGFIDLSEGGNEDDLPF